MNTFKSKRNKQIDQESSTNEGKIFYRNIRLFFFQALQLPSWNIRKTFLKKNVRAF